MKKFFAREYLALVAIAWIITLVGLCISTSYAQFAPGQPLTASQLNSQLGQKVDAVGLAAPTGAGLVGFNQNLTGAAQRTVQQKERETVSVTDWPDTNPSDQGAMFAAAVQNAPAANNVSSTYSAVPLPLTTYIRVPARSQGYTLTSQVPLNGRDVTWLLDPGVNITGIQYLSGTIVRDGFRKTKQQPFGIMDQATGQYFAIGNSNADSSPPVTGVTNTQGMANYGERDAVGLVAAAYSPPALLNVATATYTATTATVGPLPAATVAQLRVGMVIQTAHATPAWGILQSWTSDGSVLTVAEWDVSGGTSPIIPADGVGLNIGSDKIWAINGVMNLTATGSAKQGIGQELSIRNGLGDSTTDISDPTNRVWGYLAAAPTQGTAGYFRSQSAFMARGYWSYGFTSQEQDIGFYYRSTTNKVGYQYYGTGYGIQFINPTNGYLSLRANYTGDLELGTREAASAGGRKIVFQTSGNSNSYDTQILSQGGSTSNGAGTLQFSASGGSSFTGPVSATGSMTINDATGAANAYVSYQSNGATNWRTLYGAGPSGAFCIQRLSSGTLTDSPMCVSYTTGVVSFVDGITVKGTAVNGDLVGTTGSIGGSALAAGACATGTATVSGATTGMAIVATPVTYPGAGFDWQRSYVSSANTVTVQVCADVAGTPTATTYNVRVLQ
ncbi:MULTISPECIES: hypothetical protein [unclassified Burkholderia]|uniref:hypothetical protein n=1 Tax=unclassified Burkholderia TaxID=2613784 RepID=UPI000F5D6C50|nr:MULTISPECIES: hypothetical protein [unclassified Burkholderia]